MEDFEKYIGEEPVKTEKTGDIEIVAIKQETINEICEKYNIKATLSPLKLRERDLKGEKNKGEPTPNLDRY